MGCDRNAGETTRKSVELPVDDEFSLAAIDDGLAAYREGDRTAKTRPIRVTHF
jgi:hypothetical protein